MAGDSPGDVTRLLAEVRAGNASAQDQFLALLYDELHQVATGLMSRERPGHTLQTTALVHEAVLRLVGGNLFHTAQDRREVLTAAAKAMRRILVEYARSREAEKRGGGRQRVPLDEVLDCFAERRLDVRELDEALEALALLHRRQSQVVELRFFGGYTIPEVAELLGVAVCTVESDFRKARAFLYRRLREGD